MIPNHKWVKPEVFINKNEVDTPCYLNIEGRVFSAHTGVDDYQCEGFYVYHYSKYSVNAAFFSTINPLIYGVTIDDGQGVPVLS